MIKSLLIDKANAANKILKTNFFSGFNLYLSSINPSKKKEVDKKMIEKRFLFEVSKCLNSKSKNIRINIIIKKLNTIIMPPNKGTFDLCFFNLLSGLSKMLK